MKAAEVKTAAAAAKSTSPFFQKGGSQSLQSTEEAPQPFFQKKAVPAIQTKLSIGQPNDKYEQEADAVADKVVQRLSSNTTVSESNPSGDIQAKPLAAGITPLIQRKCAVCGEKEKLQRKEEDAEPLTGELQKKPIFESNTPPPPEDEKRMQRKCAACEHEKEHPLQKKESSAVAQSATPSVETALSSSKGSGSPLAENVRNDMENSFGSDFSNVRIHSGSSAAQMSNELNAQAFTHGNDIYFNSGKYDPQSGPGRHLLAHELTHTIQQNGALSRKIQRSTTRGAGGCGPLREVDEDNSGARGAGSTAHRQIQSFLLTSNVFGELPIPRSTKNNMGVTGCQPESEEGFEDLFRLGMNVGLAEIKPYPGFNAVAENEHYIRRANQSMSRFSSSGECAGTPSGDDDRRFADRLGVSRNRPAGFYKLGGILTQDTVIGRFDGDQSRTLKARLIEPGAVGYWCTGTGTDTYICGSSQNETDRYIDQVLMPMQDVADEVIRRFVEVPLDNLIASITTQSALAAGQAVGGGAFAAQIQMINQFLPPGVTVEQLTSMALSQVGPYGRAIILTMLRRLKSRLLNEIRIALRNALRQMVQDALAALCVGAAVVTLAQLMDEMEKRLKNMTRQLIPVLITPILVQLAEEAMMAFLAVLGQVVTQIASAIGDFLGWLGDLLMEALTIIARILAVVLIALMIVGVVVLAIAAIITLFDPVPGDEVALGAASAALARLIPVVWSFVTAGPALQGALAR